MTDGRPVSESLKMGGTNHSSKKDNQLLQEFVEGHNQQAMSEIIARHGSLVMGVCRRILKNDHDTQDAFQATFLVLLKKADSLNGMDSLAGWLYAVAHRVALKARSQSLQRQRREGTEIVVNPTAPPEKKVDDETVNLIHSELAGLPEQYRLPLVLCCIEGGAREDVAQHLGWSLGSLKGRLERGRDMLIGKLKRHGIILSAGVVTSLLAQEAVAEVPAALAGTTVNTLLLVAAGETLAGGTASVQAAALAQGVLKAMFLTKLKIAACVVLAGGAAAVAVGQTELRGEKKNADTRIAKNNSDAPKTDAPKTDETNKAIELAPEDLTALRRASSTNMKQLGLAFFNYEATYGTFPAAAIYSSTGKPLLSWRVAILPYIDQNDLYKSFNLDEPWDSPHNKPLLAKMPDIFRATLPGEKEHTDTFYQVFTGKGTPFEGAQRIKLNQFKDGPSNTMLIVEAGKAVPWTKPEELVYDANKPLPKLGGMFKDGFYACLGDGSARFVPKDLADAELRPWITPAGGDKSSPF